MNAKLKNTTRRHIIAAAAALAPAGALAAVPGTGANDAALRRLFAEWGPLEREYRAAASAESDADEAYCEAIYRAPKRAHDGLETMRIRQVAEKVMEDMAAKGEFADLPLRPISPEDRAAMIERGLKPYMEEGETTEEFIEFCGAEVKREIKSKKDARARFRLDELRAFTQGLVQRERELSERMAAIQADTLSGVALKLQVAQSIAVQKLSVSIMEDIRRLSGLPSGIDEYGDDAFLINVA